MARKLIFDIPFIGYSKASGLTLLQNNDGNFSTIIAVQNPVVKLSANETLYQESHLLYESIVKTLGTGYILQKTDVLAKKKYNGKSSSNDFIDSRYFEHFSGRYYASMTTYITITRQVKKTRFFTHDAKDIAEFCTKVHKVIGVMERAKMDAHPLSEGEIGEVHSRFMAMNFSDESYSYSNIAASADHLTIGKPVRIISLVDIDEINLPNETSTHQFRRDLNLPTDNLSFLSEIPGCDTIIYNQVIFVPDQLDTKKNLELKKKRHASMPDAANMVSVEDIDEMLIDIAKDNELLVHCHFSIMLHAELDNIGKAANYVESALFSKGIIPSKNCYNQMELFRGAIPGNADELQVYDKFLTSNPAAICFFFHERLEITEDSRTLHYFTDRQGVPVGIDMSELPMQTGRIFNRNKVILGPSGSGKSFFTNSYVRQCHRMGADIVLVDTGHSYKGLCQYLGGKYISYQDDKPITMNPFLIVEEENNIEKRDALMNIVGLLWKGVDGKLNQVESTILSNLIAEYYTDYFGAKKFVTSLSFNSFYEFSLARIEHIRDNEKILFNIEEYRYILKKFYQGGMYERILNDMVDTSLFNESFIVFEIDSIKEHKELFPIITLVIMDVFIQKMRHKSNKKALIIEEAWKAIASPMMAGYIVYLYKTVRKFAGEAIIVTQEVNDIMDNPVVKESILANSDTICLLDQAKFRDNYERVARLLSLNEVEVRKIFTINRLDNREGRGRFKEVYIKRGGQGEVYGVEVPIEEYLTYTTERSEKEAIQRYIEHYGNYADGMAAFMADYARSGLSLHEFIRVIPISERLKKVS